MHRLLNEAGTLAVAGRHAEAREKYEALLVETDDARQRAIAINNIAALQHLTGETEAACANWERALQLVPDLNATRRNLESVHGKLLNSPKPKPRAKVAILSLLFNWPSTAGGIVHTAETGKFLAAAGYEVRHFSARFDAWEIGKVAGPTPVPVDSLDFTESDWNPDGIRRRFREALREFGPDAVIVTDSWNSKVLLAEAASEYPYFLRLAAQECLCPLNNVRLLVDEAGQPAQCTRHQLATPDVCRQCVASNGHHSGGLHQAERLLAGFGESNYPDRLHQAFANSAGILAVNPLIGAMVEPYANQVHIVPSGFDASRFLKPAFENNHHDGPCRVLFAGLVSEFMKGFQVLFEAANSLWAKRQDFRLVVTSETPDNFPNVPFVEFAGWQSQEDLPRLMQSCDVLAFPTVAQEALGRSTVEAMAAGLPVVASQLGGLSFVVQDGATGLLFRPGDASHLAQQLARLLDDPQLRQAMGIAGRQRFEEHFTWDVIIDRHYHPMLDAVVKSRTGGTHGH